MKPDMKGVWGGTELIHIKPTPGTLIIFPGYLEHEYAVDHGIEPFRFIHWNIQALPKGMAKEWVLKKINIPLFVKQYQKT